MRRSKSISLVLVASVSAVALAGCDDTPPDTQPLGEFFNDKAACVAAYQTEDYGNKTADEANTICSKAEEDAKEEHAKTAPKFASREECEQQFGPAACVPAPSQQTAQTPAANTNTAQTGSNASPGTTTVIHERDSGGGGNSFMPFMLGYMLGGIGNNGARTVTPTYYGPGSYKEQDRDRREIYTGGSSGGGAAASSGGRPIGYVYKPAVPAVPSASGVATPPRSVVISPSRSTGGLPTPSSISNSLKSSTAISTRGGFGSSLGSPSSIGSRGSYGSPSAISSSARGGFGGTGASFSAGS